MLYFQLAGFGKPSSTTPSKYCLLTEAEYDIKETNNKTFNAENTSGNLRLSDMGSGLFVNDTNHWTLAGIMCNRIRSTSTNSIFKFTNVGKFIPWIRSHLFITLDEVHHRTVTRN